MPATNMLMLSSYFLVTLLAISGSVAVPLSAIRDVAGGRHSRTGDIVLTSGPLELRVLDTLRRSLNFSLQIANEAANLGNTDSAFTNVVQASRDLTNVLDVAIPPAIYLPDFSDQGQDDIYDALKLFSDALEGELDVFSSKADKIRGPSCNVFVLAVLLPFDRYKKYSDILATHFADQTKKSDFLGLPEATLKHKDDWVQELNCDGGSGAGQTWQDLLSSLTFFSQWLR